MLRNKRGSLVLEASIILPIFITAVLAFISFLQIVLAEMALHQAVNEATKQAATHVYPIYVLQNEPSVQNIKDDITNMIPEGMEFIAALQKDNINTVKDEVLNVLFLPYLHLFIDKDMLNESQIKIVKVTLPNLQNKQNVFFGIEASYTLKLLLPFMKREIKIQKKSLERVWIGG
ncbi:TadE/TadG family type IV pilus assembly protein [Chengkuizengella axinellae]|uniref:Pilus assembly protein n=1 Tax=Chengkuizengella axinellae TaxID=3064388 RepID=A0ABT9IXL2_9BACL|nr:hypothetical protein [Chengkuizengella sp. 2205SS18-9]MDP5274101.1 hypothetical protein [Chengkuizengella sp. 2205SS18-9]